MRVTISYCAECGFGPLAVRIAESLIECYDTAGLDEISIVAVSGGVFEVRAGDRLVAERSGDGLPKIEDVVATLGKLLT
jgi:selenoprotein W-related protein